MSLTREILQARRDQIKADMERAERDYIAMSGALQQAEWALAQWDEPPEPVKSDEAAGS